MVAGWSRWSCAGRRRARFYGDTGDPCDLLGLPFTRAAVAEEIHRLLERAYETDPDFAVLWLAATTGARRGELCALRWESVDLEAAELLVLRNLFQAAGRLVEDTKTHAARRLALSNDSVALLESIGAAAPSGQGLRRTAL